MFIPGIYDTLFPSYNNPANSAKSYYDQVPGVLHEGYDPYVQAGGDSMASFQEQLKRMTENPTGIVDDIGSHYEQSPGYQSNVDAATKAAMNAGAANGQAGSPAEQEALAKQISGYASQDYNNYVNQGLGEYNAGVSGYGKMTDMGYQASTGLADSLANSLMTQGNLQYAGQMNMNNNKSSNNAAIMGAAGSMAGLLF
jgi:hypothetical protein